MNAISIRAIAMALTFAGALSAQTGTGPSAFAGTIGANTVGLGASEVCAMVRVPQGFGSFEQWVHQPFTTAEDSAISAYAPSGQTMLLEQATAAIASPKPTIKLGFGMSLESLDYRSITPIALPQDPLAAATFDNATLERSVELRPSQSQTLNLQARIRQAQDLVVLGPVPANPNYEATTTLSYTLSKQQANGSFLMVASDTITTTAANASADSPVAQLAVAAGEVYRLVVNVDSSITIERFGLTPSQGYTLSIATQDVDAFVHFGQSL